jgi:hypothetical protein
MNRARSAAAVVVVLAIASAARADGFLMFLDDRPGFQASLDVNPLSTVVDSGGAFAPNPAAATNLASVTRSGTIGGQTFTWVGYDINFSNTPTGHVTPGTVGGDIASATPVDVETPVSQGTATGAGSWGLDSGSGSTTSRNALLVDFTTTPGGLGVGHFALDLVDFEAASAFTRGTLRVYRAGSLVFTRDFDWGAQDGNNQVHFLGVVAVGDGTFDQVALVVGDDSAGGGNSETWAADRFTFGSAIHNPEPGTVALFALGAAGLGLALHRRRRAAASTGAKQARREPGA